MTTKTLNAILQIGLIVRLHSRFPVQEVIEIGDAMMAVPIPVLAISAASLDAFEAMAELTYRYDTQMLVGVDDVEHAAQIVRARAAGATFVLSAGLGTDWVRAAFHHQLLPIPAVTSEADLRMASDLGCRLVSAGGKYGGPAAAPGTNTVESVRWIVREDVDLHNIQRHAAAGASAVCIGGEPLPYFDWSMAVLITRARRLRSAWESSRRTQSTGSEERPDTRTEDGRSHEEAA